MKTNLLIFGDGSHSNVVVDEINKLKKYTVLGKVSIKNKIKYKNKIFNIKDFYEKFKKKKIKGIVAIGDNKIRRKVVHEVEKKIPNFKWETLISKDSIISDKAKIGEGSMIISGTVININTNIGKHCLINTRSTIDHDNTWEDFTSSGPGVSSAGNVKIKKNSHIGIGSTIKEKVIIGENTLVGGHSFVNKNCKKNSIYYGVPAQKKN
jgi:sugar O-acyltransferase (sialic acid O-acetyltransferase NeuD family)